MCVCVCVCMCMCAQLLSHVQLFTTPWTVARQAPLSLEFFRQVYWSRLPFTNPQNLLDPGAESVPLCLLHWQVDSSPLCHLGSLYTHTHTRIYIHLYIHMYVIYVYTHTHIYTHIYIYVIHVYIYIHTHTYIYTSIHTYM